MKRSAFPMHAVSAFAGAALAVIIVMAFGIGGDTVVVPGTVGTAPAPAAPSQATAYDDGIQQVRGTEYDRYEPAYICRPGYDTIQVPVGQTMQQDGSSYKLEEQRSSPDTPYSRQQSVTFAVQLAPGVSAPGAIVNTAAHKRAPDLYPQSKLQVNIGPGGSATHTLQTNAYAANYQDGGITDITLCLRRT